MVYDDDNMIPLSAMTHFAHCPRRCALVHLEQIWRDNQATVEGEVLHEKAHSGDRESRGKVKIIRSLRLSSIELGITGITDIVEFHAALAGDGGVKIPYTKGTWIPFPIEYKRGASKDIFSFKVQLCAQALCLEEMLRCRIEKGSLFLGVKQHRTDVIFDESLREQTKEISQKVHELFKNRLTPPPIYSKRCDSCSLIDMCKPKHFEQKFSAKKWIDKQVNEVLGVS